MPSKISENYHSCNNKNSFTTRFFLLSIQYNQFIFFFKDFFIYQTLSMLITHLIFTNKYLCASNKINLAPWGILLYCNQFTSLSMPQP